VPFLVLRLLLLIFIEPDPEQDHPADPQEQGTNKSSTIKCISARRCSLHYEGCCKAYGGRHNQEGTGNGSHNVPSLVGPPAKAALPPFTRPRRKPMPIYYRP